jgi:hypothetical protein
MSDAEIRIPKEVHDRLAAAAAAEGMSLRAWLIKHAKTLPTPAERSRTPLRDLREWTGFAPTPAEEQALDGELDRRLSRAAAPRG